MFALVQRPIRNSNSTLRRSVPSRPRLDSPNNLWSSIATRPIQAARLTPDVQPQLSGNNSGGTIFADSAGSPDTWMSDELAITIQDKPDPANPKTGSCFGSADPQSTLKLSETCPILKGPFCRKGGVTFMIRFTVDNWIAPRLAGFTPPRLSVHLAFADNKGKNSQTIDKKDDKPVYTGQANPLRTSFGEEIPFSSDNDGTLDITLRMADLDSRTNLEYSDHVKFETTPCV